MIITGLGFQVCKILIQKINNNYVQETSWVFQSTKLIKKKK